MYGDSSTIFQAFGSDQRVAKQGLATADDFRFLRAWWEIGPTRLVTSIEDSVNGQKWATFAKGGEFSPHYSDPHLIVNWGENGHDIKTNLDASGKVRSNVWMLRETEVRVLLSPWPDMVTTNAGGLNLRVLPAGCIFSDKGPTAFIRRLTSETISWRCSPLMNSRPSDLSMSDARRVSLALRSEVGSVHSTHAVPELMTQTDRDSGRTGAELFTAQADLRHSQRDEPRVHDSGADSGEQTDAGRGDQQARRDRPADRRDTAAQPI